jgi:hypothetical protein
MNVFKVAGWIALAAVLVGVAMNYPDLKRYMKIESM